MEIDPFFVVQFVSAVIYTIANRFSLYPIESTILYRFRFYFKPRHAIWQICVLGAGVLCTYITSMLPVKYISTLYMWPRVHLNRRSLFRHFVSRPFQPSIDYILWWKKACNQLFQQFSGLPFWCNETMSNKMAPDINRITYFTRIWFINISYMNNNDNSNHSINNIELCEKCLFSLLLLVWFFSSCLFPFVNLCFQ